MIGDHRVSTGDRYINFPLHVIVVIGRTLYVIAIVYFINTHTVSRRLLAMSRRSFSMMN